MLIVFCFQAYNDIDHMTPVIDRLRRDRPDIAVAAVIFNLSTVFSGDFRIEHLKSIGVRVSHVLDHVPQPMSPTIARWYFGLNRKAANDRTPRALRAFLRLLGRPIGRSAESRMAAFEAETFLDSVTQGEKIGAVAYDHTASNPYYNAMSMLGRERGFKTYALPHAVDNWDNDLLDTSQTDPFPNKQWAHYLCDAVLLPDHRNREQMESRGAIAPGQGVVLGSPRFCDEWIGKIRAIAPPSSMPAPAEGAFRVAFMLCRPHLNIFEDEVLRMIKMVSRIPDVAVAVKLHTRDHILGRRLPSNIVLADNDLPSAELIDWANLTLFSATSVILDNVKLDRPVVFLRRTVANKLVFERYVDGWAVDCRDDLRDLIVAMKDGEKVRTYSEGERIALLQAMVEPEGGDVLGNYVRYITAQLGNDSDAESAGGVH